MRLFQRGCVTGLLLLAFLTGSAWSADDLAQLKTSGVLRHLAIPYANFNSGAGDGLEVEMMQLFAKHLGVTYQYVPSQWSEVIADLTGHQFKLAGDVVEKIGESAIKGDIIATGFTVLSWREKVVDFSDPTFPTQVWLTAPAESALAPIRPTGTLSGDIRQSTLLIGGKIVLGKAGTCLDPALYRITEAGATAKCFAGGLNDLAPALLKGEADLLLLDVPDALVALRKWPGKTKILGPMSEPQYMAAAFRKDAPALRAAFNAFLGQCKQDGSYMRLIQKYYPDVTSYYPGFFRDCKTTDSGAQR